MSEQGYHSDQHTRCAVCGIDKHTPLRRDEIGGYVCLTCIDKMLDELSTLKAQRDELLEAAKDILELYDDDIGMEAFPCATQVKIKSTTLGVLRNFRAAIANAEKNAS